MRSPGRSTRESATVRPARRPLSRSDRTALVLGVLLAMLTLSFFAWRMVERVTSDRSSGPVSPSTPTPPAPPAPKSRFAGGPSR